MGAHDTRELNVVGLVGPGGCGSVCTAEDAAGNLVAVKYFDGMAIQRSVLSSTLGRLRQDGWPQGVMPILSSELEGSPAWVVMPLVADTDVDGTVRPRSLQYQVNGFPQKNTWDLLLRVARALAALHEKRVAHGNLKPGNIFLDSSEKVMLSDWALGNMPGVSQLEFTDALLYQPPEQLREAEGYLEEAGYRWDVFAFGVLAFRLMTGEFPRCNDIFIKVAPSEGETRRHGIHADLEKIARNLELQPLVTWPKPPPNKEEESRRKLIVECLHLDPALRPSSMLDVLAGLEEAERSVAPEIEQTSPLNQFSHAERKRSWWRATACFAVGGCLLLGALWLLAVDQSERAEKVRIKETAALRSKAETAVTAMEASEKALSEAKGALEYERKIGIARLEASRNIGDRLFSWAMEKGHRELPPLDGRLERLKALEKYFEDFLGRIGEIPQLEDERARIKIQLAEIALAAGDSEKAIARLSRVPEAWKDNSLDEEYRLRMATNRLLLAMLLKSNNDPRMADEFVAARKALGAVRKEEVDADRLQQLIAILDFHEANVLAVRGDTAQALSQLMSATQSLNRLAVERPDAVVLRSALATCYLSSATILEGMGNLGDARETQALAAQEISKMLKANPKDIGLRLDLAGCFGVMAEAALFSGDIAEAEARSTEAIRILQELLQEQPDHVEVGSRLASQIGLKAGLMRDKGEADAAQKLFDEALRMLEGICASHPDNPLAGYRLALLWWQKGKMLGMAGKRDSEIDLIRRAHGVMTRLEADKNPGGPPMEKIQRSSGYLLGDLGHALHLAGKNDEAIAAFAESASFWERLLKTRPKNEEYQESLTWCRQRIKELK